MNLQDEVLQIGGLDSNPDLIWPFGKVAHIHHVLRGQSSSAELSAVPLRLAEHEMNSRFPSLTLLILAQLWQDFP